MKINELLTEYASRKVNIDHKIDIVVINPSGPELINMANNSLYGELRCLYGNGKFYFWKNDEIYHFMLAQEFGLRHGTCFCFYVFSMKKKVVMRPAYAYYSFSSEILEQPYIKKWFKPNVMLGDTEVNELVVLDEPQKLEEYAFTKVPHTFNDLSVAHNPNKRELKKLVDKSAYKELRGIYNPKKDVFYWWDASELTHDSMSDKLEIADIPANRITLYKHRNKDYLLSTSSSVMQHEYIQKNFQKTLYDAYKLRVGDSLDEYASEVVHNGPEEVRVAINPSSKELQALIDKSHGKLVRGYYDDGKFFFWEAWSMIHRDMANALGIEYDPNNALLLSLTKNGYEVLVVPGMASAYKQFPYFNNNFEFNSRQGEFSLKRGDFYLKGKNN